MVEFQGIETVETDPIEALKSQVETLTFERNEAIERANSLVIANGELVAQITEIMAQKQAVTAEAETLRVQ